MGDKKALLLEMMRLRRLLFVFALLAVAIEVASGCSSGDPPLIADPEGGVPIGEGGGPITPCEEPAPGCPCADAGAQSYCGVVYRYSGTHVDCSPGYLTCGADGGWGACVGAAIYDGN